jgi:transposase
MGPRKKTPNKSTQDAGRSSFLSILADKTTCAGKRVEAANLACTTQDCSNICPDGTICGERIYKKLSVGMHVRPRCCCILDRDENAARIIQWRGQRLRRVPVLAGAVNREPTGL